MLTNTMSDNSCVKLDLSSFMLHKLKLFHFHWHMLCCLFLHWMLFLEKCLNITKSDSEWLSDDVLEKWICRQQNIPQPPLRRNSSIHQTTKVCVCVCVNRPTVRSSHWLPIHSNTLWLYDTNQSGWKLIKGPVWLFWSSEELKHHH